MSTSKRLDGYPLAFFAFLEAVVTEQRTIRIPHKSLKEARTLRLKLYGLRNAIELSDHRLKDSIAAFETAIEPDFTLVIRPPTIDPETNSKYQEALKDAGVDPEIYHNI